MIERAIPVAALLALPLALRIAGSEAGLVPLPTLPELGAERPLLELLPADAIAVIEAPGLAELASRGLDDPLVRAVLDGGVEDLLRAGTGAGAADLLARGDQAAGFPLLATAASVTRGGAALAIEVGRGGVVWTLALRGDDHELLLATLLGGFSRIEAENGIPPGAIDGGRRTVRGADVWTLGDDVTLAVHGALLLACNAKDRLEDALDRVAETSSEPPSIADAMPARTPTTIVRAAVDLDRLDGLSRFGNRQGMEKLRAMHGLPGVQLVLGAGVAELGSARTLGFALELEGTRLCARVSAVGTEDSGGLSPSPGELAPPVLARNEHDVANALVYRDLAAAFRERVDRFAPESMPGFAKAETDLALFFGGEDLARDVLPGISPWMRVVAREIEFSPERRPENTLPAAAVILALDAPDDLGPELTTAFQTLIGAINLQRAQERRPGFLLALERAGEHTLTTAGLPTPGAADGIDLAYNLEPACVRVGSLFVLATHSALARQLVAELGEGRAEPRADLSEHWSLDGASVARLVAANRETLVAQNALEKGHSFEAARGEIAALERLVGLVETLRAEVTSRTAGDERSILLTLEFGVLPAPERTRSR